MSLRSSIGIPDGNGQGWDAFKAFRAAFFAAAGGMALMWLVKATSWAGDIALTGAHATIALYEQVPLHQREIEALKARTLALERQPAAMPPKLQERLEAFLSKQEKRK